jgi:uncharacterized protein
VGYPVTWFDLGAADVRPLKTFYAELFRWDLQDVAPTYTRVDTRGGGGVNGGIGRSGTGDPWASFYVETDDPGALLRRAESMGGRTVVPPTEIPATTFAMFDDPDGLLIGLMTPFRGEWAGGGPSPGDGAAVDWFEVLGSDAERTQSFYRELFGWRIAEDGGGYALVEAEEGGGIAGGIGAAADGLRWATVYASVPDIERRLAHAEELGGARVYGPNDVGDHMRTGAIRDPAGNVFGVYQHEAH